MEPIPAPPDKFVDAILGTASRRQSAAVRFVPERGSLVVQSLTGGTWQDEMKIPEPLGGQVIADLWARAQRPPGVAVSLIVDLSNEQ